MFQALSLVINKFIKIRQIFVSLGLSFGSPTYKTYTILKHLQILSLFGEKKTAKWPLARVHKLTRINAVHWACQEKLAE